MYRHQKELSKPKGAYYFAAPQLARDPNRVLTYGEIVRNACEELGILFHDLSFYISPDKSDLLDLSKVDASGPLILHCEYPLPRIMIDSELAIRTNLPVILLLPRNKSTQIIYNLLPSHRLKYAVRFTTLSELQADLSGALRLALEIPTLQHELQKPGFLSLVEVVSTINQELMSYLKQHPEYLYRLKPRQFEQLIAEILANFGWDIQLTPETKDGGYDIYGISRNVVPGVTTHWIIECKRYNAENRVGVEIVRALYGTKTSFSGVQAMLATTSFFTRGASAFKASRYDLHLRDFNGIVEWLNAYHLNEDGTLYIRNPKVKSEKG